MPANRIKEAANEAASTHTQTLPTNYLPRLTLSFPSCTAWANTAKPMAIAIVTAQMLSHMSDLPWTGMRKRACGDLVSVVRASWPPVVVTVPCYLSITQRIRDVRYSNPLSNCGPC
jgi:hypothetical protein